MKISFTGHRPEKIKDLEALRLKLKAQLEDCLKTDPTSEFFVGGAPGFDTLALEVLLTLVPKEKITLAVPFRGFEKYSSKNDIQNQHAFKLNYSCGVKVLEVGGSEGSFGQKCYRRNHYLVQEAELLIAFHDGSKSGTGHTVTLAKLKHIPIINLY